MLYMDKEQEDDLSECEKSESPEKKEKKKKEHKPRPKFLQKKIEITRESWKNMKDKNTIEIDFSSEALPGRLVGFGD